MKEDEIAARELIANQENYITRELQEFVSGFFERQRLIANAVKSGEVNEILSKIREMLDQIELGASMAVWANVFRILQVDLPDVLYKITTDPNWATVDEHIRAGKKIPAIKEYRHITGEGLADSKRAVEARQQALGL